MSDCMTTGFGGIAQCARTDSSPRRHLLQVTLTNSIHSLQVSVRGMTVAGARWKNRPLVGGFEECGLPDFPLFSFLALCLGHYSLETVHSSVGGCRAASS